MPGFSQGRALENLRVRVPTRLRLRARSLRRMRGRRLGFRSAGRPYRSRLTPLQPAIPRSLPIMPANSKQTTNTSFRRYQLRVRKMLALNLWWFGSRRNFDDSEDFVFPGIRQKRGLAGIDLERAKADMQHVLDNTGVFCLSQRTACPRRSAPRCW